MKPTTRAKLRDILARCHHSTFVSFTALTKIRTLVGAPVIWKLSRVNICCGHYVSAVTRARAKEGNEEAYVPKPRKWGIHRSIPLVEHVKDGVTKHYLAGQVLKARAPIYLVEYPPLKAGRRPRLIGAPKETLAQWLPVDRTAETAAAQGVSVEHAIIHRDYSLEHLSLVSIGGEVLSIKDNP